MRDRPSNSIPVCLALELLNSCGNLGTVLQRLLNLATSYEVMLTLDDVKELEAVGALTPIFHAGV